MNVLVIPEDFRKDQYMLKPLVSAMLRAIGAPTARVRVCQDPLLGGISEALNWVRIAEVLDRYRGMVQLFLLCVDRDDQPGRVQQLRTLEQSAAGVLPIGRKLLAEHAWQEIEVWVLAGHPLLPGWSWAEIRSERDPKERYFRPLAEERGLLEEPGQGRLTLGREAAANYTRIRQLCAEIAALETRVDAFLRS